MGARSAARRSWGWTSGLPGDEDLQPQQAEPVGHHDGLALDGSVPLARLPSVIVFEVLGAGQAVVMPATSAVMPSTRIVFEIARMDVRAPRRRGSSAAVGRASWTPRWPCA